MGWSKAGRTKGLRGGTSAGEGKLSNPSLGEAIEEGGQEVNHHERANAEECAERELVLRGNDPAQGRNISDATTCGAFGQFSFPAHGVEQSDPGKPNNAAQKSAQEDGQEGVAWSHKSTHHGHHFHVAKAHAFALAGKFVKGGRAPKQQAT